MIAAVYLGQRARLAVQLLNASFDRSPIVADGEGWWLVPRTPTSWDKSARAPQYLRWSDATVIGVAVDQVGLLVADAAFVADSREVLP